MVRAGQLSKRQKTNSALAARIKMTSVKATGHEKRPDVSDFSIGCWTLNIERFLRFSPKKYRPPRPMGVKGGCSPQNNLQNLGSYYPSLKDAATKISINYAALLRDPLASQTPAKGMSILKGRSLPEKSPSTCGIVRCAF